MRLKDCQTLSFLAIFQHEQAQWREMCDDLHHSEHFTSMDSVNQKTTKTQANNTPTFAKISSIQVRQMIMNDLDALQTFLTATDLPLQSTVSPRPGIIFGMASVRTSRSPMRHIQNLRSEGHRCSVFPGLASLHKAI